MRELNSDVLLEKLKSMPSQKLSSEAKSRIIKSIRSSGIELQLKAAKVHKRWMVCTAAAVFIAAAVFSAGAFTGTGRQFSSKLLSAMKSLYTGSDKDKKLAGNIDEKVTPSPSPVPANNQTETDEDLLNANSYLQYIKMADKNSGWAVSRVSVFRTDDGGNTWKDVSPKNCSGNFAGQYFLDKYNGLVAFYGSDGYTCRIFRTSDGGVTWKQSPGSIKSNYLTFYFNDGTHGWAIAHKDAAMQHEEVDILKTSDGGSSWSVISSAKDNDKAGCLPFYGSKSGLSFNSLKSGWISGYIPSPGQPYFYHSNDGGLTWKAVNLPVSKEFKNSDALVGTPQFFSESNGILPVEFSGDEQSYVFYLTHDGGNTWNAGSPITLSQGNRLYWNFLDSINGFAFNGDKVYITGDSGSKWTEIPCTTPLKDISQVNFIDENTGIAVSQGVLYETDDGGRTWYKKQTDLPYLPYAQMSSETKDEDAAKALLTKYLDHYKGGAVLKSQKIAGYKIDEIKVSGSSESGFTFSAKFSLLNTQTQDRTYWTGKNNLTMTVSRVGSCFTITSID